MSNPTGNPFIDALAGTSWLDEGFDNYVTYFFDQDTLSPFSMPWLLQQKTAFRDALNTWSNIADIQFEEVSSFWSADLVEALWMPGLVGGELNPGVAGEHTFPNWTSFAFGDYAVFIADLFPNSGSMMFETFVHEIGHALGLAHPHDDGMETGLFPGVNDEADTGEFQLNQTLYTVMSYNAFGMPGSTSGNVAGPMAFDIAAIQQMYGANTSYRRGDDSYDLESVLNLNAKYLCIWDAGGNDTISYDGTAGVTIDLRAATLENAPGGGGYLSTLDYTYGRGGYTIAHGAVIENAIGGSGRDRLIGNDAANILDGRGGYDLMIGGRGDDIYYVDNYIDTVTELADEGIDTVRTSTSFDLTFSLYANIENVEAIGTKSLSLTGNSGNNVLTGNSAYNSISGGAGDDTLSGGGGSDTIDGGLGNDVLDGGSGADTMDGGEGDDRYYVDVIADVLSDFSGDDSVYSSVSWTLADGFENLTLTGSAAINATGSSGDNLIVGNGAKNTLSGGAGFDTLIGGAGDDTYILTDLYDFVVESIGGGSDTIESDFVTSLELYQNVENLTLVGAAALALNGNSDSNRLTGNNAANSVYGGAGNDVLKGGLGNDKLYGGAGLDTFVFNSKLNASTNRDTIYDFYAPHDTIWLENAIMTGLGTRTGTLKAGQFWASATGVAHDADDRIIYNNKTGVLTYDSNGSAAGGAVQFAILSGKPGISYADFIVI